MREREMDKIELKKKKMVSDSVRQKWIRTVTQMHLAYLLTNLMWVFFFFLGIGYAI